ncbi:dcd2B [Symbiodinium microadriaticum]|nr:dcd2B [Symbiodinium microadriaticum]
MGYAVPGQRGTGIHQRLRARAFVIEDEKSRVAFVSGDFGMGSDLVKMKVIEALTKQLGEGIFTDENVAISGTHTHSGPAGFLQYTIYQITSWGFVPETFDTFVNGITEAIIMAYKNAKPGRILIAEGELEDSNINRSPTSYLLNPEQERARYTADTDKNMLLLRMVGEDGSDIGAVNWFAVHGTSMNNTNTLVSGDNKGYASYLLEKDYNKGAATGQGSFVSAFAATNLGDVSPNTAGPKCIDTGLPCDGEHSSCNGRCENCIAFGPGTDGDMFESTEIIGRNQYDHATKLMQQALDDNSQLTGAVDFRLSYLDMPEVKVPLGDGSMVNLCKAALGYSFAAGTTDGPGMMNFTQGTVTGNPFWDKVRDFLSTPTEEEIACQEPKPILFHTGDMLKPYAWEPATLPIQILRVGNLFIAVPPAEFTTMAGRRLREKLRDQIAASGVVPEGEKIFVTIAGLANGYSHYVTTFEEYQAQRYEAASTLYGPHTLEGYQQEFGRIMDDMLAGTKFGDVVDGKGLQASYAVGSTAKVTFHAANPRNNQRIQDTYLSVDHLVNDEWVRVAVDGDWSTKFEWLAGKEDPLDLGISGQSTATISWTVPSDADTSGSYRICYFGNNKDLKGNIHSFSGCSSEFTVIN